MAGEQVQDAFVRMADSIVCRQCGHTGFTWKWKQSCQSTSGTTLGADKVPHLTCRGCGDEVDGL